MAELAITRQIKDALKARLQSIRVSDGYRTDAGEDVRTEPAKTPPVRPMLTIFSGGRLFPGDARTGRERQFEVIVEARIPVSLDDVAALTDDIDADLEDALDEYLAMPAALPLAFVESLILDRPDGHPEMVIQQMYVTRYRR